jgi:putative ABC transport system permease protein
MDASFLIVLVLIVLCCMAATYFSCRKVMNIHPAESFRPASPKSGKPTVFEKLPFWNKLGFASQYDLRDISRGKLRAFMGVFGTAAGMMIMVAALASFSTIDKVSAMTFDKIQNFKNEIDFSETITIEKAEEYKALSDGELILATAVEVAPSRDSLSEDRKQTSLMVIEGEGRWNLTDTDGQIRSIPSGTCAITRKLADTLGVKVGDKLHFHLYEKNTWYELEIGLINRHPTYSGVTMLRSDYEALGESFIPTKLFTQQETLSSIDTTSNGVLAVHDDADLRESLRVVLEMLYTVIGIFIAFAVILPMVVLFNSGNLSFNERVKEFATLKVLGFKTKRIRKLLSLQNLWLSVLGVILGAPFGTMLLQYMFDSNGDSYDFPVCADWWVYVVSGGFVILISVLVGFMFNRKIKKLDMVEILKGMD